ncbi:MAG: polyprenol monophosphomannose synthase [Leucobacter sp.]
MPQITPAAQGGVRPPDVLVIFPTFNERYSLERVVGSVLECVPHAHVLIVDDASPDGTGVIADRMAAENSQVRVLHRAGKQGLGTAYVAGFRYALEHGYPLVAQMDADGSHLPGELPVLLGAMHGGAMDGGAPGTEDHPGLVIGSRWIEGGAIVNWPWYRRLISRTGTLVARIALRSRLRDITSGFRVIDTDWLRKLDLDALGSEGYVFQVETAWLLEREGCQIAEVPITFVERAGGHSKMTFGIVAEALSKVLRWGLMLRLGRDLPTAIRRSRR